MNMIEVLSPESGGRTSIILLTINALSSTRLKLGGGSAGWHIQLKLPEEVVHVDFLVDDRAELCDRNPSLLHRVALADGDAVVVQ